MLATFPDYHHGLDLGPPLLDLGLSEAPEVATTYTRELLERDNFGLLCFLSSSSYIPLPSSIMAGTLRIHVL
jgi:hypothetical protein